MQSIQLIKRAVEAQDYQQVNELFTSIIINDRRVKICIKSVERCFSAAVGADFWSGGPTGSFKDI